MSEDECYPVHDDPVVQLLAVMARSLREWPPKPQAEGEWDPSPFLPGGSRYIPKLMIYGTPVSPVSFIPFSDPEEIAARERAEAARKALAVLRGPVRVNPGPALAGQPCASCVLPPPVRLLPLGFPFPPGA